MPIVPKATSNITPIKRAKRGGRASVGYDPTTSEESYARGSQEEFDALALNTGSAYREDRFYTRSVDKHGHGEKMSLRIPQGIDSQMHKAVAEVIEYHSLNDLVRDAVMHRLEYLQHRYSISNQMQELLEIQRLKADLRGEDQIVAEHQSAAKELNESLQFVWNVGDIQMFQQKLERGSLLVDQLRDPYRKETAQVLREWRATSRERIAKMEAQRKEESP